jgi:hypothetical protein
MPRRIGRTSSTGGPWGHGAGWRRPCSGNNSTAVLGDSGREAPSTAPPLLHEPIRNIMLELASETARKAI